MTAVAVALGLVVALLGVLVVGLLRSHAEILRALHDLGVNPGAPAQPRRATSAASPVTRAPRTVEGVPEPRSASSELGDAVDISGEVPGGGAAHVAITGVPHSTLLAFLSTGCATCGEFWAALADDELRALAGDGTRVVIVTQGTEHESEADVAELAPAGVTTVMSSAAWDDHDVPVSPYFLLVDGPSGRIVGEGAGTSWEQVVDLLGRAVADAGMAARRGTTRRELLGGGARAARADRELAEAGIEPGDPSLYPEPLDSEPAP